MPDSGLKLVDINRVDRALLIKLRNIGDVLLTSPVFSALKDAKPGIRLTAVVPKGTEDMLSLNPDVDEVIAIERGKGILYDLGVLQRLRAGRFDLAINMTEGDRGAIMAFLSGARYRIGVETERGFWGKRRLFTHLVKPVYDGRHRTAMDMDMLFPLGIENVTPRLSIHTSREDDLFVEKLLSDNLIAPGERYAVVHPTSRWLFKCWRDEAVAEVIDYLEGRGIKVVVTSGPDERETARIDNILKMTKSTPLDLSGRLSLKRLASLMKKSVLFFGVDTAPMHMAAAVGVPVVALFGPSDSGQWGPLSARAVIVDSREDFDCIPCMSDGCNGTKKSRCLDEISVESAVSAIDKILDYSNN